MYKPEVYDDSDGQGENIDQDGEEVSVRLDDIKNLKVAFFD